MSDTPESDNGALAPPTRGPAVESSTDPWRVPSASPGPPPQPQPTVPRPPSPATDEVPLPPISDPSSPPAESATHLPPPPFAEDKSIFAPQMEPYQIQPELPAPTTRKSEKGVFAILGFLLVALAGLGAFWLSHNDQRTEVLTTVAPSAIDTPAAPESQEVFQRANIFDGVADIAENVRPTVVQLDTSFSLGSGVIYSKDGYILTAAHVIEGARTVQVRLADGRLFDGEIVGSHTLSDIAVVKIDAPDLPVAKLAVGIDIRVGSLAVALGSPFGLDQSVTAGIVSAVDREIQNIPMVQTDAAINPGNSGGPLVDGAGRVIGINDQIFTTSGGNEGVGFAVSIGLAKLVADQLVTGEDVQLSFLGVSTTTSDVNRAGALVQEVVADSAAETAGIEIGDLIISVDGDRISSSADLRVNIINTLPGNTIRLEILRKGLEVNLTAVLGSA